MGRGFTDLILPAGYSSQMLRQVSRLLDHVWNTTSYFFVRLTANQELDWPPEKSLPVQRGVTRRDGRGIYCTREMSIH